MTDQELAQRVAEISPKLPYDLALRALEAGGRPRDLILSVVQMDEKYAEDNASIAASKKKLVDLIPA